MKTSKNKSLLSVFCALILASLMGYGCESHTSITDSMVIKESQIEASNFNPQPEPPPKVLEIEAVGDPSGDWTGQFPGFREGRFEIETLSSTMRGKIVHVVQMWTIVPPEPIFPPEPIVPPDPIVPPEPILVSLKGMINLANGKVVLNGMSEGLGVNVHVRGLAMILSNGEISIGGEVMFNPQPEPPPSPATTQYSRN